MLYLTIDKVLDIYLHLKYSMYFPKNRVVKILLAMWITSMTFSTGALIVSKLRLVNLYDMVFLITCIYLTLDFIVLIASIISFSYMLTKVWAIILNSHREVGTQSVNTLQLSSTRKLFKRKCLVPCLIILSYIVFNMTSFLTLNIEIAMSTRYTFSVTYARFLMPLGLIADSLIYIFMQRQVWRYLKRVVLFMICEKRGSVGNSVNMSTTNCCWKRVILKL